MLAPTLPGCNPPSMTLPTWCVSSVERLPVLVLACGAKLLLAPVVCGHLGCKQQCHHNESSLGFYYKLSTVEAWRVNVFNFHFICLSCWFRGGIKFTRNQCFVVATKEHVCFCQISIWQCVSSEKMWPCLFQTSHSWKEPFIDTSWKCHQCRTVSTSVTRETSPAGGEIKITSLQRENCVIYEWRTRIRKDSHCKSSPFLCWSSISPVLFSFFSPFWFAFL